MMRVSDNLLVVLPMDKVLEEEIYLSRDYHYPISSIMKEMLEERMQSVKTVLPTPSLT